MNYINKSDVTHVLILSLNERNENKWQNKKGWNSLSAIFFFAVNSTLEVN
jgi:hypothetical protein